MCPRAAAATQAAVASASRVGSNARLVRGDDACCTATGAWRCLTGAATIKRYSHALNTAAALALPPPMRPDPQVA